MVELAPGAAVVPLEEVKAYLRLEHGEEDGMLAGLVRSAGEMCEAFTGTVLVDRAVVETIAASGAWARLSARPVRAIERVTLVAFDGSETVLAAAAYAIDVDAAGVGWVRVGGPGRARVGYRAGMAADWNGVPEPLRHGVVRLAAHLYGERGGGAGAGSGSGPPAAVTALWRPWRVMRLG